MVRFKRNETKVLIEVEHGIFSDGSYFSLEIDQSYNYQAELLKNALQNNLNRNLSRIREEAYNEGWRDAKAKTKKRTFFYEWWR